MIAKITNFCSVAFIFILLGSIALALEINRKPIMLGAAVGGPDLLNADRAYRELIADTYKIVSPENAFKFRSLRDETRGFQWDEADQLVAFAKSNKLEIHGHVLVWHIATLDWLFDLSATELDRVLRNHISTTVQHFAKDVVLWDVVNEALMKNGKLRPATRVKGNHEGSVWRNIGDDYIAKSFRWAKDAANREGVSPKLLYNDYSIETRNAKSDALFTLVTKLKNEGVPIDGIGFQFHIDSGDFNSVAQFKADVRDNLSRFADAGFEIHITEFDVAGIYTESALTRQAEIYEAIASVCHDLIACKSFTTWGVTDKYSWLRDKRWGGERAAEQRPLPFDDQLKQKPAFAAMLNGLGK